MESQILIATSFHFHMRRFAGPEIIVLSFSCYDSGAKCHLTKAISRGF
jgi:hypothetical protein